MLLNSGKCLNTLDWKKVVRASLQVRLLNQHRNFHPVTGDRTLVWYGTPKIGNWRPEEFTSPTDLAYRYTRCQMHSRRYVVVKNWVHNSPIVSPTLHQPDYHVPPPCPIFEFLYTLYSEESSKTLKQIYSFTKQF